MTSSWFFLSTLSHMGCTIFSYPHCHMWAVQYFLIHTVTCGLYNIFPHCLLQAPILEISVLNIKCVFRFSLQLSSEAFLLPRSIQPDITINVYRCLCKALPSSCLAFMKPKLYRHVFRKIRKYQIS